MRGYIFSQNTYIYACKRVCMNILLYFTFSPQAVMVLHFINLIFCYYIFLKCRSQLSYRFHGNFKKPEKIWTQSRKEKVSHSFVFKFCLLFICFLRLINMLDVWRRYLTFCYISQILYIKITHKLFNKKVFIVEI